MILNVAYSNLLQLLLVVMLVAKLLSVESNPALSNRYLPADQTASLGLAKDVYHDHNSGNLWMIIYRCLFNY